MVRFAYSLLLLLWALAQPGFAQDTASSSRRNLAGCLSGLGVGCDEKLLTQEQAAQVRGAALRRNHQVCTSGSGYGCNEALLTPEQVVQIREAGLHRNYRACVSGRAWDCNEAQLTAAQKAEVRDAAQQRNYRSCVSGRGFGCDASLLAPDQNAEVRAAELRRNHKACLGGLKFGCNEKLLTPEQTAEVHDAALRRNFVACVSVLRFGCNEGLLTAAETEQVRAVANKQAEKRAEFQEEVQRQAELLARWRASSEFGAASFNCDSMPEAEIAPIIDAAARANQMQAKLLRGVIERESAYYACAISRKGAKGLMQLMPATIQQFGVTDPFDATQNVVAGARYLKQLMQRYNGDLTLALAAYNAGPGTVDQASGIPNIKETRDYVDAVMKKVR